ncbi:MULTISPECIES: hypothetical protein [Bacillales]|uniref:hypothetical protein n=1 Tax=Bacillales TaxID=1385 RepID=UPI000BEE3F01|nr:hypothetical protein [Bacillus cereus]PED33918.1 hypothetical protein CON13_01730 [Bacillus cereus]PEE52061.1 hypothetical protein COM80_16580 [Bacillus cereus]PFL90907.1 hypothetical protein COJ35_24255 [Bacillus cereus]PFV69462.1 hypothetical protein COL16_18470 [Bacillus cereus]PGS34922.1 hypothetical protein COC56_16395 [Bacillus cereus]
MKTLFKRKKAKEAMQRVDTLTLGEKKVRITKITPRQYKELFSVIGNIPNLVYQVANAPEDDYRAYVLMALEVGMDDIVGIVSYLTGIDAEYLHDQANFYDLTEYLVQMVEYNNIEKTLKNVASLLPKAKTPAEKAE